MLCGEDGEDVGKFSDISPNDGKNSASSIDDVEKNNTGEEVGKAGKKKKSPTKKLSKPTASRKMINRAAASQKGTVTRKQEVQIWSECPCGCGVRVSVGKHGPSGRTKCPHCEVGDIYEYWPSEAEFHRHVLQSAACIAARTGTAVPRMSFKKMLGEVHVDKIDRLQYKYTDENWKERFKCYMEKCIAKHPVMRTERFKHCVACFRANNVSIPADK